MFDTRLIIVGAQSLATQVSLVRRAGRFPPLTSYGLQNFFAGLISAPFYCLQRLLIRAPKDMPPPVFIVGCWRSGTTFLMDQMTKQLNAAAPRNTFTVCPSSAVLLGWFWKRVLPDLPNRFIDPTPVNARDAQEFDVAMWRLTPDLPVMQMGADIELSKACKDYANSKPTRKHKRLWRRLVQWAWIHDRKPGRPFVLKTPSGTLQIPMLLELWPDAKFVYIEREEAGQLASFRKAMQTFPAIFSPYPYTHPVAEGAKRTRAVFLKAWAENKSLIPEGNWIEVSLAEVSSDTEGTIKRIAATLGL